MAATVRGNGLYNAERALAALAEDERRLERARRRFSDSPPSYTSHQSHNSTRSQSPNQPSEEERRHKERHYRLMEERDASRPYDQLIAQEAEERERIIEEIGNRTRRVPIGTDYYRLAHENVKKRWIEQGIWKHEWKNGVAFGSWKHEEPLEPESRTDTDAGSQPNLFSVFPNKPRPEAEQSKTEEERRQIEEQQAARVHQREASRPFYQFIYQVSRERDRIQHLSRLREPITPASADINTNAYQNVKNTWMKRGIWNQNWGVLPGMSWKHEKPLQELEEESADSSAPIQTHPPENGGHEAISRSPIFEPFSSVEIPRRQESTVMDMTLERQAADIEVAGLVNGDAESYLRHQQRGRRALRSTARRKAQLRGRKPSQEDANI